MFANERYEIITSLLQSQPSVTVPDLMRRFNVSIETVRRDLSQLEQQGILRRVHGGAVAIHRPQLFVDLSARRQEHITEKRQIAEAAAQLIHEDDWIFLDSGSTALVFAEVLCKKFHKLSIATYSIEVMTCLAQQPDFSVYLSGGRYMPSEQAFYGAAAQAFFSRYHASWSFLCPASISLRDGACDFLEDLMDVQRAMMAHADETVLLADSSKFSIAAPVQLCPLRDVGQIITDSAFPADSAALFQQHLPLTVAKS